LFYCESAIVIGQQATDAVILGSVVDTGYAAAAPPAITMTSMAILAAVRIRMNTVNLERMEARLLPRQIAIPQVFSSKRFFLGHFGLSY
jgi:hypothetical protein